MTKKSYVWRMRIRFWWSFRLYVEHIKQCRLDCWESFDWSCNKYVRHTAWLVHQLALCSSTRDTLVDQCKDCTSHCSPAERTELWKLDQLNSHAQRWYPWWSTDPLDWLLDNAETLLRPHLQHDSRELLYYWTVFNCFTVCFSLCTLNIAAPQTWNWIPLCARNSCSSRATFISKSLSHINTQLTTARVSMCWQVIAPFS